MDKILVFNHIREVNDYIKMPDEPRALIEDMVNKIASDYDFEMKCNKLIAQFFVSGCNQNLVSELAKEKDVDGNMLALAFGEISSIEMKKLYLKNGWPMDIYFDSLIDLTVWAKVCLEQTGKWGLNNLGWIYAQITGGIVRLERLQFHQIHLDKPELPQTMAGVTVKNGSRAINIHIPEGDALTKEKRLASYRKAYKFFNQTGNAIFTCHSWLLNPRHRDILPPTSNILSFMDDFILFGHDSGTGDLWRVFGSAWPPANNNYDLLPQKTDMQKGYVNWLKNGTPMGGAFGLFIFDGENIIS